MSGEVSEFNSQTGTRIIAIGAILSALYAILVILPISAFIGAGSILSGAIFIAPLFGILLGPRYGFVFGAIGGILATIVSSQFGGLYLAIPTIIAGPAISGFLTGLSRKQRTEFRGINIPGPMITMCYIVVVIILYLIPNFMAWWFIIPYAFAGVIVLGLQFREISLDSLPKTKIPLGILLLTVVGTMTDFSMMTLGSVYLLNLPSDLFGYVIFPVMLIERTAAVLVSTIIAGILISSFKSDLPY
ncbi:MAG: ECF transporter S component [Candidatus Hodarchaeales archaeon]